MILRLALRGLRRVPRRAALAGAALAFAVAALVVALALVAGTFAAMVRGATRRLAGDAMVTAGSGIVLDDADTLRARLREIPGVLGASVRLRAPALVRAGGRRGAAEVLGIDPAAEAAVSDLDALLEDGAWPAGPDVEAALLGRGLAQRLGAGPGDAVLLELLGADGTPSATVLRVAGVVATGDPGRDGRLLVTGLGLLRDLLGAPGAAHEIGVSLANPAAARAEAARIAAALGAAVTPWQGRLPALAAAVAFSRASSWWLAAILEGAAGLVVLAVLLLSFHERRLEHALCLALGMPPRTLRAAILAEALLLGAAAAGLGAAAGAAVAAALAARGLDVGALIGPVGYAGGVIEPVLRASLDGRQVLRAAATGVAVAGLAGWIAGRRLRGVLPAAVLAGRAMR